MSSRFASFEHFFFLFNFVTPIEFGDRLLLFNLIIFGIFGVNFGYISASCDRFPFSDGKIIFGIPSVNLKLPCFDKTVPLPSGVFHISAKTKCKLSKFKLQRFDEKKSKIPIWPVVFWRKKTTIQNDSLIRCAWQKRRSGCFGDFFNIGIIGNAIFAIINLFLTPLQNQWICFQFFILLTSFTAANGARWSGAGSRMAFISFEMTSFGTASIHSKMLSVSTFGSVHDDATVLRHGKIDWTKSIVSFSLFFFVGEQNVNWFWPGKKLCQNIVTICFERVAGKFK